MYPPSGTTRPDGRESWTGGRCVEWADTTASPHARNVHLAAIAISQNNSKVYRDTRAPAEYLCYGAGAGSNGPWTESFPGTQGVSGPVAVTLHEYQGIRGLAEVRVMSVGALTTLFNLSSHVTSRLRHCERLATRGAQTCQGGPQLAGFSFCPSAVINVLHASLGHAASGRPPPHHRLNPWRICP